MMLYCYRPFRLGTSEKGSNACAPEQRKGQEKEDRREGIHIAMYVMHNNNYAM